MSVAGSNFINAGSDCGWLTTKGGNAHTSTASENPFARVSLYNASWNSTFPSLYRGAEVLMTKGAMQTGRTSATGSAVLSGLAGASLEFYWMIGRFTIDVTSRGGQNITMQVQFNMVGKQGTGPDAGTSFTGSSSSQYRLSRFFTFANTATSITSVSPSSGPLAGGTVVTISGTDLTGATVTIGGTAATVTATTDTSVTAVTPASSSAGAKDVVVSSSSGTATLAGGFTYLAAPTISGVTPSSGPTAGGTAITISGTALSGATVTVGGVSASVSSTSATTATAITPAAASGARDVIVTTGGGSATLTDGFTYVAAPSITSIAPVSGATLGGTVITLVGTNLSGATVTIGGVAATVTASSATSLTIVSPSSATVGVKDVVVTTVGGSTTRAGAFTYFLAAPTITSVMPSSGPTSGGTSITISGTSLGGGTVAVGGLAATVSSSSATSITATTPASSSAGARNVTVTTSAGSATVSGGFTYVSAPTITAVTPGSGPIGGGTSIVVVGTNLSGATVTIGGSAATVSSTSPTTVTAVTPAGASPGAKNVVVTTVGGSATRTAGFTYLPAPTIATVSPSSGPLSGGTTLTILGTNLSGAIVTVGGVGATVTSNTSSTVTAVTPVSASSGAKNLTITTPGGTATRTGAFTYLAAPTITSVTPASGPLAGGTTILIAGNNLAGAAVKVGGVPATVIASDATAVSVRSPASTSTGARDVAVTTAGGVATRSGGFTYMPLPIVTSATPSSGPISGGTSVKILGTNLQGATVTFGGLTAAVTSNTGTAVTVNTPESPSAGVKVVQVVTAGGTANLSGGFTYLPMPTIGSITP
ncbi:MAG: IPT/TIG domain-containing protein, partial [Acidobacteria bacterium]|nr:IPT/TIG domain-containing protein [Acidobacteriota bacterium]